MNNWKDCSKCFSCLSGGVWGMWDVAVLKGVTSWHITSRVVADDTPPPSSCLSDLSVCCVCLCVCVCWSLNCDSFASCAVTDSHSPTLVVYRLFRGYILCSWCTFLSTECLCLYLSACISNVSPQVCSRCPPPPFFFVPGWCFCRYCIMNALRRLLMHSKCHNVTDPVAQNDYLVPVSNAL